MITVRSSADSQGRLTPDSVSVRVVHPAIAPAVFVLSYLISLLSLTTIWTDAVDYAIPLSFASAAGITVTVMGAIIVYQLNSTISGACIESLLSAERELKSFGVGRFGLPSDAEKIRYIELYVWARRAKRALIKRRRDQALEAYKSEPK